MSNDIPPEELMIGAVRLKSISDIQKLMQLNVDINCEGLLGMTPLLEAVRANDVVMVELLIAYGADVNHHNSSTLAPFPTALIYAAAFDFAEVAGILLEHHAEVDLPHSRSGKTPLMFAAENNSLATAKLLIAAGADLTAKSFDGTGPYKGNTSTSELLNDAGFDLEAKIWSGTGSYKGDPLTFAAMGGARDVVELLLTYDVKTKLLKRMKKEIPKDMLKWLKAKGAL